MAENIDSLLVSLGLETDRQSFQQGMSMFNGLRGAAMSFVGVIGAGVGARALKGFASDLDTAGRSADRLGVSVGYMTQLGDAMAMAGGNGAAATAEIENMVRLLDEFRYNTGGDAFSLAAAAGLDPAGIADAENAADAYQRLLDRASSMNDQQRRVALGSLGFGQETNFLAQAGPEQVTQWMQTSQNLAERTDEMVDQAREFNQALGQLNIGIRGLSDAILVEMMPELTSFVDSINEWLGEEGRISKVTELVREGPQGIGERYGTQLRESIIDWASETWSNRDTSMRNNERLMQALGQVESGNRHRNEDGSLVTNPHTGARGRYQIMPATGRDPGYGVRPLQDDSEEEHRRFATEYLSALIDAFDGSIEKALAAYNWGPGNVMRAGDNWQDVAPAETRNYVPSVMSHYEGLNREALEAIQQRQESGNFTAEDREYLQQQMRNEFPERYQGNVTIHVTGSNDPEATARAVRRELTRQAEVTMNDFYNPVV